MDFQTGFLSVKMSRPLRHPCRPAPLNHDEISPFIKDRVSAGFLPDRIRPPLDDDPADGL
jgi:hypothetical protein